eukprot:902263_1
MHRIWKYLHKNKFQSQITKYSINTLHKQKYRYKLPPMLILNIMLPDYAPSMGKNTAKDGEGFSLLIYCHLSEATYKKLDRFTNSQSKRKLPMSPAIKLFSRFIKNKELQKQRLKIITRVMNMKYSNLGFFERQVMNKYNSTPFLAKRITKYYYEEG